MFPHAGSGTYRPVLLASVLAVALVLLLVAELADGAETPEAVRARSNWTPQRMESARQRRLADRRRPSASWSKGSRSAQPASASSRRR
jgi:hypothetical protein